VDDPAFEVILPTSSADSAPSSGTEVPSAEEGRAAFLRQAVEAAKTEPTVTSVRNLIGLWGWQRRGSFVTAQVTKDLQALGLTTFPPFTEVGLDDRVRLVAWVKSAASSSPDEPRRTAGVRIGSLPSATRGLVWVRPEDSLQKAQTLMLVNDYSQLAVMRGPSDLTGAITWESVAKALLRRKPVTDVKKATVDATLVRRDADLLQTIPDIVKTGFVFVRDQGREVTGIVTTADLSEQFADLAGPFMLLNEIEVRLRIAIGGAFSVEELASAKDPADARDVVSVHDLSLGELARLLDPQEHWERLRWELDRKEFLAALQRVRRIRNEVMHFSPDPLRSEDLQALRTFLDCLRTIQI
jgi:CBS domain-containing protein